ncbi:MAG: hypothetical protein AAFX90_20090 [Pseudomonadota bacterium]
MSDDKSSVEVSDEDAASHANKPSDETRDDGASETHENASQASGSEETNQYDGGAHYNFDTDYAIIADVIDIHESTTSIYIDQISLDNKARLSPLFESVPANRVQIEFSDFDPDSRLIEKTLETLRDNRVLVVRGALYEAVLGLARHAGNELAPGMPVEQLIGAQVKSSTLDKLIRQAEGNKQERPGSAPGAASPAPKAVSGALRISDVLHECPSDSVIVCDLLKIAPAFRQTAINELCVVLRDPRSGPELTALATHQNYVIVYVDRRIDERAISDDIHDLLALSEHDENLLVFNSIVRRLKVTDEFKKTFERQLLQPGNAHIWGRQPDDRFNKLKSLSETEFQQLLLQKSNELDQLNEQASAQQESEKVLKSKLERATGLTSDRQTENRSLSAGVQDPKSLSEELSRYILLCVVRFEGITLLDLDLLMRSFLGNASRTVREKVVVAEETVDTWEADEQETDSEEEPSKKTATKYAYEVHESRRNLRDEYERLADDLLHNLGLAVRNERVEFTKTTDRAVAEALLQERLPKFVSSVLFRIDQEEPLLFTLEPHLAQVLTGTYVSFLEAQNEAVSLDHLTSLLNALWVADEFGGEDHFNKIFAEKASLVLFRLLEKEGTRGLVQSVLASVLRQELDNKKAVMFLFLVGRLNISPFFKTLFWIKRFVFEVPRSKSWFSKITLAQLADPQSSWRRIDAPMVLSEIANWVPRDMRQVHEQDARATLLVVPCFMLTTHLDDIKPRDRGQIDVLLPFFDLHHADGLYEDVDAALDLVLRPVTGPWLLEDLASLEKVVRRNWGIKDQAIDPGLDLPAGGGAKAFQHDFSHLMKLQPKIIFEIGCGQKSRYLRIACMLVEAIALFLDDFETTDTSRRSAVDALLQKVCSHLDDVTLLALNREVFEIQRALSKRPIGDEWRYRSAKLIVNTLHHYHKSTYRQRPQASGRANEFKR